jgi:xylulokinase
VTLAVDEGPALGAALLAAVGTGAYPTVADACRASIRTVARTAPDPDAQQVYARLNPVYRALYPALKDQFAAVSEAVS